MKKSAVLYGLLVAVITVGFVVGFGASVLAVGNVGGKPARPDEKNPRTNSIFIHTIEPGASASDATLVSNTSEKSETVELYAVDAMMTNTGSLSCRQQTEAKTGVGAWVKLAQQEVTLDPHANQTVEFAIQVSQDASPGEHNGCLVFQKKEDEGEVNGSVRLRTRQAVRIAITVPGELHKQLELSTFDVTNENGARAFRVNLKNTGNVSADTDVRVVLRTVFGQVVREDGGDYPVLPNKDLTLRFLYTSSSIWGGWYVAQALVRYDGAPATFGIGSGDSQVGLHSPDVVFFIMPHPLVVVGGAIVLYALINSIVSRVRYYSQSPRAHRSRVRKK